MISSNIKELSDLSLKFESIIFSKHMQELFEANH